jgi:hypothetical protein
MVPMKKLPTQEPVKLTAMEPAALLHTLAYKRPWHGCAAICFAEPHRPAARRQRNSLGRIIDNLLLPI